MGVYATWVPQYLMWIHTEGKLFIICAFIVPLFLESHFQRILRVHKCRQTIFPSATQSLRGMPDLFGVVRITSATYIPVVFFFVGDTSAPEFYIPTFRNILSVPERRHIKFRRRGITQKKENNIQNTAKVLNQE
jgi:hypothetical protein